MRRIGASLGGLGILCLLFVCLTFVGCGHILQREGEPSTLPASYHITAELLPREHLLRLETEIAYSVPSEGLSAIKLALYANAYHEGSEVVTADKRAAAYSAGIPDYGGAEIKEIRSDIPIIGQDLGQDERILTLRFARTLAKGERITLHIDEEVSLARIRHRLGYSDGYFSLSHFYPEVCPFRGGKFVTYASLPYGDPFLQETSDFLLDLTLPVGYECACSVHEDRRENQGTFTTYSYALSGARDIAVVASKNLRYVSGTAGETPVRYYYESDSAPAKTLSEICEAVDLFSSWFGGFPYPSYTLAVAPFCEAGVEHSGMGVVSKSLSESARRETILHETAHQWWYGKVGNDEFCNPWMDEGLAEFSVAAFYKAKEEEAAYRTKIRDAEDIYAIRLAIKGGSGVRFDLPLDELSEGYYDRAYCGGLLLFSSLAEEVGFSPFLAALHNFADTFAEKVARPEDLIASLSASLGKDCSSHFNAWLSGNVPVQ